MSEEFAAVAGHRVLDLVNTVDWRLSPEVRGERLGDDGAAVRWAREFGFCTDREASVLRQHEGTGALAAGLREVREWIYRAALEQDVSSAAALQRLHSRWQAHALLTPVEDRSGWRLEVELVDGAALRQRVSRAAVEFLTSPDGGRVRQCADDACGWVFLDTSPRRNRRWCVAEDCGARNRARKHYQRTQATKAST